MEPSEALALRTAIRQLIHEIGAEDAFFVYFQRGLPSVNPSGPFTPLRGAERPMPMSIFSEVER